MVGIYKIINNITNEKYVGQSLYIEKRLQCHKNTAFNPNDKSYNYPLYQAIRQYGLENFTFEIIEECNPNELNDKERYWIQELRCEYNQAPGGSGMPIRAKLNQKQVVEIQELLLNDKQGTISHSKLAEQYCVSKDTIQGINAGRIWYNENLSYPLHISQFNHMNLVKNQCCDCGKEINRNSIRCVECENIHRRQMPPITRDELKNLIRIKPFTKIGKQFGISDNAIRKWCDKYNLPRKSTEIKKYSEEEWELI